MGVNRGVRKASNREARQAEAEYDRGLIERAKNGDRGAFRELVQRHERRAFAIALGLVRDENDAREVVQEAFFLTCQPSAVSVAPEEIGYQKWLPVSGSE